MLMYRGRFISVLFVFLLVLAMGCAVAFYFRHIPVQLLVLGIVAVATAYFLGLQYDKAVQISLKDPLTGLYNRRYIHKVIPRLLRQFQYNDTIGISLVDLNDFKMINDTRGHEYGDSVLICLAHILEKSVRRTDIVARWGGDEFLIVAVKAGHREMELIHYRIFSELRDFSEKANIDISISIGNAISPYDGLELHELVRSADMNMYNEKRDSYKRDSSYARMVQ